MKLVCLDLEGVLVPEIWKAVAAKTGIDALNRTTRDEPDYDVLMRYRLDILAEHKITLPYIQDVIATLQPLEGARNFLDSLREQTQVIILSDTFVQFATPLMSQLGWPTLFCHELVCDAAGTITGYALRQDNQKEKAVRAFQSLNYEVIASGDSYNDLSMLLSADHAVLFRPPESLTEEQPQLPVTQTYEALREELTRALAS